VAFHRTTVTVLVVFGCLAVAAGFAGAVPDARLTVSNTVITPEAPDTGETVTVDATIQNSGGSSSGVTVDAVSLVDEDTGKTYDSATDVGALSVGDAVTVPLSTAFEETGIRDLSIVVETTDTDGDDVEISHPVRIVVGGVDAAEIEDDVQVNVREARPSDLESEDGQQQASNVDASDLGGAIGSVPVGGGLGQSSGEDETERDLIANMLAVEVSNFGEATARDVVVEFGDGNGSLPRRPVDSVLPGETNVALIDADRLGTATQLPVIARYDLGDVRRSSETTYDFKSTRAKLRLTDVDMVMKDGRLALSGNIANVGNGPAAGAVVEVVDTGALDPAYPQRSYFVGSVPGSDFVGFELTASVNESANAKRVPIRVRYLDDSVERTTTAELPYEPRNTGGGGGGTPVVPTVLATGAVAIVGGGALIWRRRDDWR